MPGRRLGRDIVAASIGGLIVVVVAAAGGGLWNWMSEGGLIRALGGVTGADLKPAVDPRTEACVRYADRLTKLNEIKMNEQDEAKQIRSAMAALGCSGPTK